MFTTSITIDEVIDALKAFLVPFCTGMEIVRGQVNRVPSPLGGYVVLTEGTLIDLQVPSSIVDKITEEATLHGPQEIAIQIDFYGASSGQLCSAVKQALRSSYGFDKFPENIKPLYTDAGRQIPLVTGEEEYETRWTLTAALQYNPVVTVPQQTATALELESIVAADLLPETP